MKTFTLVATLATGLLPAAAHAVTGSASAFGEVVFLNATGGFVSVTKQETSFDADNFFGGDADVSTFRIETDAANPDRLVGDLRIDGRAGEIPPDRDFDPRFGSVSSSASVVQTLTISRDDVGTDSIEAFFRASYSVDAVLAGIGLGTTQGMATAVATLTGPSGDIFSDTIELNLSDPNGNGKSDSDIRFSTILGVAPPGGTVDATFTLTTSVSLDLAAVQTDDTPVIPLPAAGWLLLAGLGGLAAMRRRA
ncbi:VPLPA-CTERM sorting domain-containing protein [Jannaschia sp. LMIT008]|uniref:VPLPA-CTERM sorting domain-containing protein n=1 Tax=Jannaschia maritima TaxID=3032585 RepID=UPI0028112766|nr:VPLPA-CTERM sorting domain-containing protein [Jannaschia sp. LMIT008]